VILKSALTEHEISGIYREHPPPTITYINIYILKDQNIKFVDYFMI
jgi:hypothetical protein